MWTALEWIGVAVSLSGAALVAGRTARARRWGFRLWCGSNAILIAVALHAGMLGLTAMYAVFLATSAMGWRNNAHGK